MVFCIPYGIEDVRAGPDGSVIVGVRQVCWGSDVPAPDLPEIDLDPPGPDLPGLDLPETETGVPSDADVMADAQAKAREDVCTEGCTDCIAANTGAPVPVSYSNDLDKPLAGTATRGYAYQQFVCGLGHFPTQRQIMEWNFAAYSWDGIEPGPCMMLEAKYGYDDFLEDDWGGDRPKLRDWAIRAGVAVFRNMVGQASEQLLRLAPFHPEVELKWVFSHQRTMIYALALMNESGVVVIQTEWRPSE